MSMREENKNYIEIKAADIKPGMTLPSLARQLDPDAKHNFIKEFMGDNFGFDSLYGKRDMSEFVLPTITKISEEGFNAAGDLTFRFPTMVDGKKVDTEKMTALLVEKDQSPTLVAQAAAALGSIHLISPAQAEEPAAIAKAEPMVPFAPKPTALDIEAAKRAIAAMPLEQPKQLPPAGPNDYLAVIPIPTDIAPSNVVPLQSATPQAAEPLTLEKLNIEAAKRALAEMPLLKLEPIPPAGPYDYLSVIPIPTDVTPSKVVPLSTEASSAGDNAAKLEALRESLKPSIAFDPLQPAAPSLMEKYAPFDPTKPALVQLTTPEPSATLSPELDDLIKQVSGEHTVLSVSKRYKEENKLLQKVLIELGYLDPTDAKGRSNADGYFGPGTDQAVKEFKADNGLKDDGKVGNIETWPALLKKLTEKRGGIVHESSLGGMAPQQFASASLPDRGNAIT